jgi:hypothetical protein
MNMDQLLEWELVREAEASEKTRRNAAMSTIHLTWPDLGSNPGRRDGCNLVCILVRVYQSRFP